MDIEAATAVVLALGLGLGLGFVVAQRWHTNLVLRAVRRAQAQSQLVAGQRDAALRARDELAARLAPHDRLSSDDRTAY